MPEDANAMSTKDTFNDVLKTLAAHFKSLATLEVHTVVADIDVTVTTPDAGPIEVKLANANQQAQQNASKALYTGANQFTGDIQTVWSSSFSPTSDTVLYQTHKDNIALSRQIFTGNLKMVGDLIREFAE
ncbi:MAG: hypothetical protein AAF439_15630 [Pseudomonadota bacterium]